MPRGVAAINAIWRERQQATLRAQEVPSHGAHTHHGYDPNQPRVPAGHSDGGQWTDAEGDARPERSDFVRLAALRIPRIPRQRPQDPKDRNAVVKEVAEWLAKNVGKILQVGTWLDEFLPTIEAYRDPPKTLEELQRAVWIRRNGYDIHHIVEQTPAEQEEFSREVIDAPENLVRIPRLKHWQITGWYGRANYDFGGKSPREYLRGKDWNERVRVGIEALILHGVLKP